MNQSGLDHKCSHKTQLCSTGWSSRVLHVPVAGLQDQALLRLCSLMGCDHKGCSPVLLLMLCLLPLQSGTSP